MTTLLVEIAKPMLRSVISIGVGRLSGATINRSDNKPIGRDDHHGDQTAGPNRGMRRNGGGGDHAAEHHPFALREIERAGALEDDVEAQGNERVDGAVAEAGKKQLKRRGACTSRAHLVLGG